MPAVEMRQVTKTYGGVHALDGFNLKVDRGEIVAMLGPNGSGKTTTFEILLGLIEPGSGEAAVFGSRPGANRSRVGAMLQSAGLPDQITIRELVRLIGRSYSVRRDVDEVLEQTALTRKASRTVSTLSGGERQRVLLAMAMIGSPELLLLDEPTAAMDVASRRAFWNQVRESVGEGTTVVFATHDLSEAANVADRVVVISSGRLIADSTPGQLTQSGRKDLEEVFLALTTGEFQ